MACFIASFAMVTGLILSPMEKTGTSTLSPTTSNCLIAAGLYISQATKRGLFPSFLSFLANFPVAVVFPAP